MCDYFQIAQDRKGGTASSKKADTLAALDDLFKK
jgi:hypothetical protein